MECAKVLLVFLSNAYVKSANCLLEFRYAVKRGKAFVVLRTEAGIPMERWMLEALEGFPRYDVFSYSSLEQLINGVPTVRKRVFSPVNHYQQICSLADRCDYAGSTQIGCCSTTRYYQWWLGGTVWITFVAWRRTRRAQQPGWKEPLQDVYPLQSTVRWIHQRGLQKASSLLYGWNDLRRSMGVLSTTSPRFTGLWSDGSHRFTARFYSRSKLWNMDMAAVIVRTLPFLVPMWSGSFFTLIKANRSLWKETNKKEILKAMLT